MVTRRSFFKKAAKIAAVAPVVAGSMFVAPSVETHASPVPGNVAFEPYQATLPLRPITSGGIARSSDQNEVRQKINNIEQYISTLTEQHKRGLVSFSEWRKLAHDS